MVSKRALIGATGQDGAYLAKHLLNEGYEVIGTSRDHRATSTERLAHVGALESMTLVTMVPADSGSVMATLSLSLVAAYRRAYNLFASSAITFNQSPLRPSRFFTKKVVSFAVCISKGSAERLKLGSLDAVRDWASAPDSVVAMHSQLQLDEPCDLVAGTDVGTSLRRIVERAFEEVRLDHREHVDADTESRPADISLTIADPSRARSVLSWNTETRGEALIDRLVQAELSGAVY